MKLRNHLIALSLKYDGDWQKIYEALDSKTLLEEKEVHDAVKDLPCQTVTIIDKEYPECLKKVRRPPFVLFYYGDLSILGPEKKNLSIIGTREPTDIGVKNTYKLVSQLKSDIVIVSGMAKGIDSYAHEAAMFYKHKTVAVLGSGIDICYPFENLELYERLKEKQLVISEYPPGVAPNQHQFPMRNRIVAGLSKCVLITESGRRSGTMITVLEALESGKSVLCVPSSDLENSGCNLCIKEGAFLVESGDDVNIFYGY